MDNEKMPKNEKGKLIRAFYIFGAIFLVLFSIVNYDKLSDVIKSITAVLKPVFIGFIIAYLCNPVYKFIYNKIFSRMQSPKPKKFLSILLAYLIILGILALLLVIIAPQVFEAYNDLISKFDGYISTAVNWASDFIRNSNIFSGNYSDVFDFLDANDIIANITDLIKNSGNVVKNVGSLIFNYAESIVISVKDIFIGLLISIYVLIFKSNIARYCKRLFRSFMSRDKYDIFMHRVNHANNKFGNYIIGAITDAILVGIESLIIFSIFGIPYAPLIAVLVGITNVIPILGPFLGAVPSAFIIFIADPSKVIPFILLIIIIQQIDGNIVAPMILGTSLGLNSLGIIIAITIMGGLWGIPGMFIGVPLFAFFADLIDESVNGKLRAINDPDFPPIQEQKEIETNSSPIIAFIKKHGTKTGKAIVSGVDSICKKIKDRKNKK